MKEVVRVSLYCKRLRLKHVPVLFSNTKIPIALSLSVQFEAQCSLKLSAIRSVSLNTRSVVYQCSSKRKFEHTFCCILVQFEAS